MQALFHFCSFKILNKIQNLLKNLKLIQSGIEKIPAHHIYQIYNFLSERDDCTPSKCGAQSEYTNSAHTEVEDPSLGCMNECVSKSVGFSFVGRALV